MQLGGFYIWTISYQMVKASAVKFKALEAAEEFVSKEPNKNLDATAESHLLRGESEEQFAVGITVLTTKSVEDPENQEVSVAACLYTKI